MLGRVKEESVVGFGDEESGAEKKVWTAKKSGGFENMGLSFPVLKGVRKRGYKIPTPIQRKTIPLINQGKDVVAMARTGSGKTACFLIPLLEKLRTHSNKCIRALILSPTRELATQTLKFVRELGKFTGLRSAIILGGDSMETQFSILQDNPDIVIATPGRFLHICVEMELKLNGVEMVVFDEADRLFEMGFGEQLQEIIQRLPETRQTLLFSATLPKVLVEFARAGLTDPVLLRLDVENKIPETLKLSFISCRPEEKPAILKYLLKHVVNKDSLTIVFAATRHHVEYLHLLLEKSGIPSSYIYSDLHPSARKINVAKFQTKKVKVLIVTDIAARGIDIPHLDYVINYNFPAKAKLFVHRVGRCARAGREGRALCLVSSDELCYMLDLHLFLGRPVTFAPPGGNPADDGSLGKVPSFLLENELAEIESWETFGTELSSALKVSENAYKKYIKSRPGASTASVKRVKDINLGSIGDHFLFYDRLSEDHKLKENMITGINNYKPKGTIFEIGHCSNSEKNVIAKTKKKHENTIARHKKKLEEKIEENQASIRPKSKLELSKAEDIGSTFSSVILGKRCRDVSPKKAHKLKRNIDQENFISYRPSDQHTEEGLAVNNFEKDATSAGLEMTGDTNSALKSNQVRKVWDRKKKKMVGVQQESKKSMIKSESGIWIPATFKSGRYQQWLDRTKARPRNEEDDEDEPEQRPLKRQPNTHWARHNLKMANKKSLMLKRPEQIVKERMIKERKKNRGKKRVKKSSKK